MAIWNLLFAAWVCAAPAPEFSGQRGWLNVPAPLTLAGLRGKVVLLYFSDDWTAAGRRTTLAAQRLEASLPKGLVVIGARSEDLASLITAVLRREISHPIVYDEGGRLAAAYGVVKPPELKLIDAQGLLAASFPNSAKFEEILKAAQKLIADARADKALAEKPLPLVLARDGAPDAPLAFPTQLTYDARRGRLYVADSGHNRLVVLDAAGKYLQTIGNTAVDYRDGSAAEAGFDHPEGLAADGKFLYVSDTHNDVLRRVDETGRVSTLVDIENLRWPRGLAASGTGVYAASGDTRDVWSVSAAGKPTRLAGGFQEPAALALLGDTLWLADSQGANLRAISLPKGAVTTPVLSGPGLPLVRPEALAVLGKKLLIADAGDGKIKSFDPATGEVSVFSSGLSQPSGLAVVGEHVIVSDTGRSQLAKYSRDGKRLETLPLTGLKPPPAGPPMSFLPLSEDVELPSVKVKSGAEDRLELKIELPAGRKLNPRSPLLYRVSETRGAVKFSPETRKGFTLTPRFPVVLKFTPPPGRSEALLNVDFYYCALDGKGLCYSASKRYRVILDGSPAEKNRVVPVLARP